jgi:hypothetical protein
MLLFLLFIFSLFLNAFGSDVVLILDNTNTPISLTSVYNSLSCSSPTSLTYSYGLNISNNYVVFASSSIPLATVTRVCIGQNQQLGFSASSVGVPITFGDMTLSNLALSFNALYSGGNWTWSGSVSGTSESKIFYFIFFSRP